MRNSLTMITTTALLSATAGCALDTDTSGHGAMALASALEVDAGPDRQRSLPFNTVSLEAGVSGATSGEVSYAWRLIDGPASGQLGDGAPDVQLFVEETGTYVVEVTATSGGLSATDTTTVYVNDHFDRSIPGRLEAENANLGNGLGYADTTPGNAGGAFRDDDLDVQPTGDVGGGFNVGWIAAGERLDFSVLSQAGFYDAVVRVASARAGEKRFRLLINGRDVSGEVAFDTRGAGWQTYQDVVIPNVESFGYVETVTLVAETGDFNVNYIDFVLIGNEPRPVLEVDAGPEQQLSLPFNTVSLEAGVSGATSGEVSYAWRLIDGPASGQLGDGAPDVQLFVEETGTYVVEVTATSGGLSATDTTTVYVNDHFDRSIPGRLEAENANLGNGLGYIDTTPGNAGGAFRDDDLDVQPTGDVGGGFNVGWIAAGERLDFSVLSQSGFYDAVVRVASARAGEKRFRLLINGRDVSGEVAFDTGGAGWQTYQDVVIPNVESFGYVETVTLVAETGDFNVNYIDLFSLATSRAQKAQAARDVTTNRPLPLEFFPGALARSGALARAEGSQAWSGRAGATARLRLASWRRRFGRARPRRAQRSPPRALRRS